MFGTKQLWWILQRWLQFVYYFCCQPQVPATADIQFYVRGLKPDEKYMAAVAAYNAHGKLIGGSIGLTCRPVLAAHPLPTLMAWGYLAQVRDKLTAWQITLVNRVFTLNTVQKRRCGRSSLIWRGEIWGETYEFWMPVLKYPPMQEVFGLVTLSSTWGERLPGEPKERLCRRP